MSLEKINASLKTGNERLTLNESPLNFTLLDFWRWSVSDILSNATRGRLAEFIVATATNIDVCSVRDEWSAYDLITPEGIKLEIKSAAYLQSWFQKTPSKISFSTRRSLAWDSLSNLQAKVPTRSADIYVFCLLNHHTKNSVDPLNLDQWEFYILSTRQLDAYTRSQHSITLKSLQKLTSPVKYLELHKKIIDSFSQHNFPTPTVIYQKGDSHQEAAKIFLVNSTGLSVSNIRVFKTDVASFDEHVDMGIISKAIPHLAEKEFAVINIMSTFDLEYNAEFRIDYDAADNTEKCITFSIDKYGRFDSVGEVQHELFGTVSLIRVKCIK